MTPRFPPEVDAIEMEVHLEEDLVDEARELRIDQDLLDNRDFDLGVVDVKLDRYEVFWRRPATSQG